MNKLLASLVILLCVVVFYQWRTVSQLRKASGEAEKRALELSASVTPDPQEDRASKPANSQVQEDAVRLRADIQVLKSQITDLEARMTGFEPFMPGKEEPAAAYFGPGRWANGDRRGLAQIVVA